MYQYYCLNPIAQVGLDKFKTDFENGVFVDEAEESISFIRASRVR